MTTSILIFFAVVFFLIFVLRMARIGTLLAFLLAGIITGPYVLGLFQLAEIWTFLGDVGVMFLWFTIGLELNMKRLWQMKRTIFGLGFAQVMMVAVMLFPLLYGLTAWSIMGTVMVALILAMSSTATDLQILSDRNELHTNLGHQTFSILLFQDLLSIPLLAMLPIFAGNTFNLGGNIIDILVMSAGLVFGVLIVGRIVLNPLMRTIAKMKSREMFLVAIMLNIVIWTVAFGLIGLPATMGAFIAGMLLSETIYRHQIKVEISPYAMMFLALFFISLGLGLDIKMLIGNWPLIAIGVAALVAIKFIAIYIVARVREIRQRDATIMALILAQGGEFGLLILYTMKAEGIESIPFAHGEILTAIIVVSMMITPILLAVFDRLQRTGLMFKKSKYDNKNPEHPDVIICGFGRVGQIVASMLASQKISYIAIDLNVDAVMMAREDGLNVVYGDTNNATALQSVGLAPRKTRAVVIALDNAWIAKSTVRAIKTIAPRVKIFARARNVEESEILRKEGVTEAWPETVESSLMLGRGVLENIGIGENKIEKLLSQIRDDNYKKN